MALLVPPPGMVPISDKQYPTCDASPEAQAAPTPKEPYVFLRGKVDITPLLAVMEKVGDDLWDEEKQNELNVRMTRPAHDKWGIKKAIFVFCDDFMKNVYQFPWLLDEDWSTAFEPILQLLGTTQDKVVRMLLASMPPACVIPPHHDTGYWVRKTHRIHVPLVTDTSVVNFSVGALEKSMQPVAFEPGYVIELNNQAKHAVVNRWNRHRVHLILDYVDDCAPPIRLLHPGAQLHQSRRTIEIVDHPGASNTFDMTPPSPSFIVLGAQKCGTTTIYECLCQHPSVVKGRRRETHFFDWRWQPQLKTPIEQANFYGNFFVEEALAREEGLITGESTPSYLLHFDLVIPRLKAVAPQARLIVVLRDPVLRAYSHYQMGLDTSGTPAQKAARGSYLWVGRSFSDAVTAEIAHLKSKGITPQSTSEEFAERILCDCPMNHGGHSMVARGLYALQLEPWLQAFPGGQIKVLHLDDLKGKDALNQTMGSIYKHVNLPPYTIEDAQPRNARAYEPMPDDVKVMLQDFYRPFNDRLTRLLGPSFDFN